MMVAKTNVYFLAEITRNYGNGDCILLENIDYYGNIIHALIDTGKKVYNGVVCNFLKKHNVKKLEFLLITHSHGDHNGDTISVIDNYQIDKLIMKEFDRKWSPDGTQKAYEDIIAKAIQKKIKKILGISYLSLISKEYSPSLTDNFRNKIVKDAQKDNFEYFNQNNIHFRFGSAYIQIMNWEIFDSEGNLFVTGQNNRGGKKVYRDIYSGENENSMGVLLIQGNKKAFFSGDMNNIAKKVGNIKIGDEDRLKNIIGKIDLLKLGHHGYHNSNTKSYLSILNPQYVVITNDVGEIFVETNQYLENNNINYIYSTQDKYEVSAIITNNNIELGFGTKGFKQIKNVMYYINEENIYRNYLNCRVNIRYNLTELYAQNWEQLKYIIEKNQNCTQVDIYNKNSVIINVLKIYLFSFQNNNCYLANSCINIINYQIIILTTKEKEIIIKRDKSLVDFPLFFIENGCLILGEQNMIGKIIIDGNKEEVLANSNLIKLLSSEFSMYNNTILRNNYNKTTKRTKKSINLDVNKYFGSAIYAINSKINMYGGEISNNIHEIYIDEKNNESKLPEIIDNDFIYNIRGVGLYMNNGCIFKMYGGKIINNEGINNSSIYTNINSSNLKKNDIVIHQSCQGIGIYAGKNCEIYLYRGDLSNNKATNNGKLFFITPKNNKSTKLFEVVSCIYGTGLFLVFSKLEMFHDFIIKNNFSELNSNINIEKNCFIEKVHCAIRGGQIYLSNSHIKIKGGLIQNSKNTSKIIQNIFNKEAFDKAKKLSSDCQGGGINFINCNNIEINKLKIEKCNADRGGAIFFNNCNGIIIDSIFESNFAKVFGGAIYIHNPDSVFQLINNRIINNITENGSGGGIYAYGKILIDGINTLIYNNIAGTYGGGIMIKTYGIMKNGTICYNKANKNSGGGIRIDGTFELINGNIYGNWANANGGGINFESGKQFIFDENRISTIVYKNSAKNLGNDIYPLKKK